MRIWMHPYLPRRNLRIVIHRWGSLSCAWRPTDSELHRWPVDPTSGNVKLLLPPRQSRGNSHYGLARLSYLGTVADAADAIAVRRFAAMDGGATSRSWGQTRLLSSRNSGDTAV